MKTFAYDDLILRYTRTGVGPPVVLLHNGGTSHVIWDDLSLRMSGYELFALDLLGFGESSKPSVGYELARHVAILDAFIAAVVGPKGPVHLVGNCMGSAIALSYAIRRPDAVASLVLFNVLTAATFASGLYAPMSIVSQRAPALMPLLSKVALGTWLGKLGVRSQLGRHGLARRVHQRRALCACYAGASQSRALLGVLADIPSYAALDRFQPPPGFPPICTIWGLDNRILRPESGRVWVATLRPAQDVWLDGCGHLPMLEDPDRVAALVRDFLGRAPLHGAWGTPPTDTHP